MAIEIRAGRYFSALWLVTALGQDWLMALYRDEGETAFTLVQRFHDADDEKRRWYTATLRGNEGGMPDEAAARRLVVELISAYRQGEQIERVEQIDLCSSDPDFILARLSTVMSLKREWIH